jgi:hypothetical protein
LLSARCATDRLRLHFSAEDLAQYGERDVLQKAIGNAVALSDYYLSIQNHLPADSLKLTESQVRQAAKRVAHYLWKERETYLHKSAALTADQRVPLEPFFSTGILDRVRTVELHGRRMTPPPSTKDCSAPGESTLCRVLCVSPFQQARDANANEDGRPKPFAINLYYVEF